MGHRSAALRPGTASTDRRSWSEARLSAAISATRADRAAASADRPLRDEVEFFTTIGTRHDVPTGVPLVRRGTAMGDVHLVQQGAVAVLGDQGGRRPILALTVRSELCGAVPALLRETSPWDAVTVMDSSVVTVPVADFTAAASERWADRWSSRILSWLAQVGACVADLDSSDVDAQVAAVLLRHRGEMGVDQCRRAICDLLDLEDDVLRPVLAEFVERGAIRITDGRIRVARAEILRATVAAGRPASSA